MSDGKRTHWAICDKHVMTTQYLVREREPWKAERKKLSKRQSEIPMQEREKLLVTLLGVSPEERPEFYFQK